MTKNLNELKLLLKLQEAVNSKEEYEFIIDKLKGGIKTKMAKPIGRIWIRKGFVSGYVVLGGLPSEIIRFGSMPLNNGTAMLYPPRAKTNQNLDEQSNEYEIVKEVLESGEKVVTPTGTIQLFKANPEAAVSI
jgi:hypothetical protein